MAITLSPGLKLLTPAPNSTTSPARSKPVLQKANTITRLCKSPVLTRTRDGTSKAKTEMAKEWGDEDSSTPWLYSACFYSTRDEREPPGHEGPREAVLELPVDGVDAGGLHPDEHLAFLRRRDRHLHMLKSSGASNVHQQRSTDRSCARRSKQYQRTHLEPLCSSAVSVVLHGAHRAGRCGHGRSRS